MGSGPFILTDVNGIGTFRIFVGSSDDAINQSGFRPRWQVGFGGSNVVASGMKLLVKSGENLYLTIGGIGGFGVTWSGYQPY